MQLYLLIRSALLNSEHLPTEFAKKIKLLQTEREYLLSDSVINLIAFAPTDPPPCIIRIMCYSGLHKVRPLGLT